MFALPVIGVTRVADRRSTAPPDKADRSLVVSIRDNCGDKSIWLFQSAAEIDNRVMRLIQFVVILPVYVSILLASNAHSGSA